MVIDTGIDRENIFLKPYIKESTNNENYVDTKGHGTHIAGIISKDACPDLELISCKFYFNGKGSSRDEISCLEQAVIKKVDIVNFSAGGPDFGKDEYLAYAKLSDMGVKLVVAAGNDNFFLGDPCIGYYPACYPLKNIIPVGALDNSGNRFYNSFTHTGSNYGAKKMVWEVGVNVLSTSLNNTWIKMTGTSQATAMHTNRLVKEMCNHETK